MNVYVHVCIAGIGLCLTEYHHSTAATLAQLCRRTGGSFEFADDGLMGVAAAFQRIRAVKDW